MCTDSGEYAVRTVDATGYQRERGAGAPNPKRGCRLYREMSLQLSDKTPKRRVKAKLRSLTGCHGGSD